MSKSETRFDVILDVVRANHERGRDESDVRNDLSSLITDHDGRRWLDQALRIVFDRSCPTCIAHPGWATDDSTQRRDPLDTCRDCLGSGVQQPPPWERGARVTVTVFDREFQGVVETTHDNRDVIEVFVPALNNTTLVSHTAVSAPLPEPTPLPNIDPVETLAEVIAIATTGLHALATEHEGNLRDAATRLHERTTALLDLVTRW